MRSVFSSIDWPRLVPGMFVTLLAALSVHVVMLQVLDIPYPTPSGQPSWVPFAKTALNVAALAVFFRLAREALPGPLPRQALIVFLLDAGLRESLRGALMEGFVTTAYGYGFGQLLGRLAPLFIRDLLTVGAAALIRRRLALALALAAIAAAVTFGLQPAIAALTARTLEALGLHEHPDLYSIPYGWQVLIPAYVTFAEPVISCTVMAALIWRRFAGRPAWLWPLSFATLAVVIRGSFALLAFDSFFVPQPLWLAFLSTGQFFLETLTLAVLSAGVWRRAGTRKASA